jgi:serine/threonine-protein kinase
MPDVVSPGAMNHPTQLGKYPITGVLGEGAMGVVYKGFDPVIRRPVAIKTIHRDLIGGDDTSGASASARFRNEAQAVGRMAHPGIVAIYEYGEQDTTAYIAMELVNGRSLSQILRDTPRLPEFDVVSLMDQLLAALDCAHRHGVWHRDIKPANLLVTAAGQLKITDFGIARIEANALTQVTSTIGTPGYMAPEQYVGNQIDHRVDLFASGVLLYRLLTGATPFAGSAEAVMYQILHKEHVPPSQVQGSHCPVVYDPIVAKALAKDANQRYSSAAQFREALLQRAKALPEEALATTIIAAAAASPSPSSGGVQQPTSTQSSGGSAVPTGWDPATLQQFERALVSFVGPMARVMVRNAARSCSDPESLTAVLGQQLPSEVERTAFRTKLSTTQVTRRTAATTASTSGTKSLGTRVVEATAGSGSPVNADTVAHARQVLTRHMGPIAGVIVKKAAAQARTEAELFEQLVAQFTDPAERDRLMASLRRRT